VDHRNGDAIGHRQCSEARVVVQNIERHPSLGRNIDLLPRARDMV